MVKITLGVDGMACGMCEAHINDAIRNTFKVKKVTSSHTKKTNGNNRAAGVAGAGSEKHHSESRL